LLFISMAFSSLFLFILPWSMITFSLSLRSQDPERSEEDRVREGTDYRGQDVRAVHVLLRSCWC
jgi:hypothetical protein